MFYLVKEGTPPAGEQRPEMITAKLVTGPERGGGGGLLSVPPVILDYRVHLQQPRTQADSLAKDSITYVLN